MKFDRLTMLMILDGWGLAPPGPGNAVHLAQTPNMDRLWAERPRARLVCHGRAVGLPEGQMGNSEVGHLNIGAGRVVYQDITRIDRAIESGQFMENPALKKIMAKTRQAGGRLHLLGLVSDGGVHSSLDHLKALVDMAGREGLERVFLQAFMDGRDTPPHSGLGYLGQVVKFFKDKGLGSVASLGGRYWGMDRDKHWSRVAKHYAALVEGQGRLAVDPLAAVRESYQAGETDEFIVPTVIVDGQGRPVGPIRDKDGVIFFNFRADRAREMTRALALDNFTEFETASRPRLSGLVTMTLYDECFNLPAAFPPEHPQAILGQVISQASGRQLRIAETEKYAHVTYFFNGGQEEPFPGEERILIPSPREVATYDQKPEMSAPEVCDRVLAEIKKGTFDFIVLNFANGDMVGHTGVLEAAIAACQTVDSCVGRVEAQVRSQGGRLLVTADHGNAEQMIDDQGQPYTAHTVSNPVPFILAEDGDLKLRPEGILGDIAPTVLELMGLEQPPEMSGRSLISR
ncbi:MAG: 2,3-bisphosphoglycerate-independent phosphoglycerate mutase [Deltaproteobacteria bacterium]|nr:2,3-bisphosphoglycerate-independent phosphoglycerate mutase [Deltaproteobacteria bacterium]